MGTGPGQIRTGPDDGTRGPDRAGIFQPLAEKSEQVPDEMTGIGWLDGRLWLYLGMMSLETGDTLRWQERRFQVRSCRPYCLGEQTVVFWAVLEEAKEAAS